MEHTAKCSRKPILVGEGWQYRVFDLGNGRVRKQLHRPLRSCFVLLKETFPFDEYPMRDIPHLVRSMRSKAFHAIEVVRVSAIPPTWLGNPTFLNSYDYEQDKVCPLGKRLAESTPKEQHAIIDAFIQFNQDLLGYGVIERSFNITKNYGVAACGNIILLDLGELFDKVEDQERMFRERVWAREYVAGCIEDLSVRSYFIKRMDETFGILGDKRR